MFGIFVALQTQWRISASGSVVGLDYSAIESVFRLTLIECPRWPALFEDLRVLEIAALKKLNEKK